MKANEVKNFGQLEEFIKENAIGMRVGSMWNAFWELMEIAKKVDPEFNTHRNRYTRQNEQTRELWHGDLRLGYIDFKKTRDGKIKDVTLSVGDKSLSWLDSVSADERRKKDEEIKTSEILKERGFESIDDLVTYLRKFPNSKRNDIRSRWY